MTDEQKQALDELKRAAKQKIRIGDAIYGIVELHNGRYLPLKNPEPDPRPVDDGGVPFKSFSDELRANGWTAIYKPDGKMEKGTCK